ncbi:hypothetical protein M514_26017 [Trichuris suis]|uniref:Calcium-transporting ATPase n=1 Tax=Trichuris suis TaxID=68888 RepID=A0A085MX69_9BILA|nr:hypothetical protein M514_26017 [Trichuris suis]
MAKSYARKSAQRFCLVSVSRHSSSVYSHWKAQLSRANVANLLTTRMNLSRYIPVHSLYCGFIPMQIPPRDICKRDVAVRLFRWCAVVSFKLAFFFFLQAGGLYLFNVGWMTMNCAESFPLICPIRKTVHSVDLAASESDIQPSANLNAQKPFSCSTNDMANDYYGAPSTTVNHDFFSSYLRGPTFKATARAGQPAVWSPKTRAPPGGNELSGGRTLAYGKPFAPLAQAECDINLTQPTGVSTSDPFASKLERAISRPSPWELSNEASAEKGGVTCPVLEGAPPPPPPLPASQKSTAATGSGDAFKRAALPNQFNVEGRSTVVIPETESVASLRSKIQSQLTMARPKQGFPQAQVEMRDEQSKPAPTAQPVGSIKDRAKELEMMRSTTLGRPKEEEMPVHLHTEERLFDKLRSPTPQTLSHEAISLTSNESPSRRTPTLSELKSPSPPTIPPTPVELLSPTSRSDFSSGYGKRLRIFFKPLAYVALLGNYAGISRFPSDNWASRTLNRAPARPTFQTNTIQRSTLKQERRPSKDYQHQWYKMMFKKLHQIDKNEERDYSNSRRVSFTKYPSIDYWEAKKVTLRERTLFRAHSRCRCDAICFGFFSLFHSPERRFKLPMPDDAYVSDSDGSQLTADVLSTLGRLVHQIKACVPVDHERIVYTCALQFVSADESHLLRCTSDNAVMHYRVRDHLGEKAVRDRSPAQKSQQSYSTERSRQFLSPEPVPPDTTVTYRYNRSKSVGRSSSPTSSAAVFSLPTDEKHASHAAVGFRHQPRRIEDYTPGHSSITEGATTAKEVSGSTAAKQSSIQAMLDNSQGLIQRILGDLSREVEQHKANLENYSDIDFWLADIKPPGKTYNKVDAATQSLHPSESKSSRFNRVSALATPPRIRSTPQRGRIYSWSHPVRYRDPGSKLYALERSKTMSFHLPPFRLQRESDTRDRRLLQCVTEAWEKQATGMTRVAECSDKAVQSDISTSVLRRSRNRTVEKEAAYDKLFEELAKAVEDIERMSVAEISSATAKSVDHPRRRSRSLEDTNVSEGRSCWSLQAGSATKPARHSISSCAVPFCPICSGRDGRPESSCTSFGSDSFYFGTNVDSASDVSCSVDTNTECITYRPTLSVCDTGSSTMQRQKHQVPRCKSALDHPRSFNVSTSETYVTEPVKVFRPSNVYNGSLVVQARKSEQPGITDFDRRLDMGQRKMDSVSTYGRPVLARVLYSFVAQNPRELDLYPDDTVTIRRQIDANWCEGEVGGRVGIFPTNYVEPFTEKSISGVRDTASARRGRSMAKVLYDFVARRPRELTIKQGEFVHLIREVDRNWSLGCNEHGQEGMFPSHYVKPCEGVPDRRPTESLTLRKGYQSHSGPSRFASAFDGHSTFSSRPTDRVSKLMIDGVSYDGGVKADSLDAILNEMKLYSSSLLDSKSSKHQPTQPPSTTGITANHSAIQCAYNRSIELDMKLSTMMDGSLAPLCEPDDSARSQATTSSAYELDYAIVEQLKVAPSEQASSSRHRCNACWALHWDLGSDITRSATYKNVLRFCCSKMRHHQVGVAACNVEEDMLKNGNDRVMAVFEKVSSFDQLRGQLVESGDDDDDDCRLAAAQSKEFSFRNAKMTAGDECTVLELMELMEKRGIEGVQEISDRYGGVEGLCQRLRTSINDGLCDKDDIEMRRRIYGSNYIPPKPPKSFFRHAWEAMQDLTLLILIAAAVISLGLSFYPNANKSEVDQSAEWIEGAAIFVAILVVVLVTAGNNYSKDKQFRGLQANIEKEQKFCVVRNGQAEQVLVRDIVVGDICLVKYGDLIPADGVIIQCNDLKLDESSLTGESDMVRKGTGLDVMVLSGKQFSSKLEREVSYVVFVCTYPRDGRKRKDSAKAEPKVSNELDGHVKQAGDGDETKGRKAEKSVLQGKLTRLSQQIGIAGTVVAVLTIAVLILRYSIEKFVIQQRAFSINDIHDFVGFIIIGITVLVIAVPEGLPLAVTLSLAYSVKKRIICKFSVYSSCEIITQLFRKLFFLCGVLLMKILRKLPLWEELPRTLQEMLVYCISINSSYSTQVIPSKTAGEKWQQLGNKTECALLGFLLNMGQGYEELREAIPEEQLIKVYTFNSVRKSMSTVIALPKGRNGYRLLSKGASEVLLRKCQFILGEDGHPQILSEKMVKHILKNVVENMASNGLRTICLAYRDFVESDAKFNEESIVQPIDWDDEDAILTNLTCISIVGIQDPVRPEVPAAIRNCQMAGITVRMVTGDNLNTARSIAQQCGIINPASDFLVLEGPVFNQKIRDENGNVKQELIDKIWPTLRVLARSSPADKYTLVKGIIESKLSKTREVVAVTGDGTNDGPALRKADVGFAMGIAGTDVAKEASDIILTDDNFISIVKAVMWGRNVYDSIAKFLQFQLTVNLVAVLVAFVGACSIEDSPLKMLWVNLIMDSLAALALATESPQEDLLKRKPYGRKKPIISRQMMKSILGHGIYQLVVVFVLLFAGDRLFDIDSGIGKRTVPTQHFTLIFNVFVLMTLFNMFNARKIHGEHNVFERVYRNPLFCIIWLSCVTLQVIVIVEVGGYAFSTVSLSLTQWMWCLFFSVGELLWGQLVISIPSHTLPRKMEVGAGDVVEIPLKGFQPIEPDILSLPCEDRSATGLWQWGVNRVQTKNFAVGACFIVSPCADAYSAGRINYSNVYSWSCQEFSASLAIDGNLLLLEHWPRWHMLKIENAILREFTEVSLTSLS